MFVVLNFPFGFLGVGDWVLGIMTFFCFVRVMMIKVMITVLSSHNLVIKI